MKVGEGKVKVKPSTFTHLAYLLSATYAIKVKGEGKSMNPSSATWYEFQFGDKNNLHYDAIIINPQKKEILIIESKRFSNVAKKTSEIKSDIDRINLSLSKYLHEFDRVENNKGYSIIGVILADVWDENSAKHSILESYKNKSCNMPARAQDT